MMAPPDGDAEENLLDDGEYDAVDVRPGDAFEIVDDVDVEPDDGTQDWGDADLDEVDPDDDPNREGEPELDDGPGWG